jgi:GWxTD domain-containing protein
MHLLLLVAMLAQTGTSEYSFPYVIEQGEQDQGFFVKAYVSLPYATLQFVKADSLYKAGYHITFQLLDRYKNLYGDERFGDVIISAPTSISSQTTAATETLEVILPEGRYEANLSVQALGTTRRIQREFDVEIYHRALGSLRITNNNGNRMLERPFDSRDTMLVSVPVYEDGLDSLRLEIARTGAPDYNETLTEPDSQASWSVALEDFSSGDYQLSVKAFREKKAADERTALFRLRNPFRFDPGRYEELVDKLIYITAFEEREQLKSVPPEERQATWDSFWHAKDPTPQTEYNEELESYFAKISYCERNFGYGDRGYLSDRARIYMRFGPPDEAEEHPFEPDRNPYIVWIYNLIGMQFVFEERLGFGEYELVYPPGFLSPGWQ